ncbi:phasin family protein [Sphingomonas panacisoli]|uniref:Phasin family protein n=1 Tax=Sphingomonas panacisoli TaxID=1813879 RepID=A0A5B8LEX6_9SPHN|nr:phasin family protein [Sphingomonas panacisoli]QDZ06295.1 phasin family protein [Sphingomonas panacisoli]
MASKTPVSKTPARKPAAKKPAVVKASPVETAPVVVAEAPAAEQPVWPVVETPAAKAVVTAVTETIPAAVAEAAPAIKKEVTKMTDTIKDAAEKGQAYFTDFTAKAKDAAAKGQKAFEDMNEFNKGNVEALVESGKIAATGLQTLGQGYADYARRQFEGTTAAFKSFAGVKSPTEFFKLHSDFVRSQFDSMVAETSKNTEAFIKLAGDVAKPISNRVAVAAEKLKVAA